MAAPEPATTGIRIVAGTYGSSCGQRRGNVTRHLAVTCDGSEQCDYRIHHMIIGDPAYGCRKDYIAEWTCAGASQVHRAYAEPEAGFGSVVRLGCPADATAGLPAQAGEPAPPSPALAIHVVAGSYGPNCRAPRGNVTAHLAEKCDGRPECAYRIHHWLIGDPVYGCAKSYIAEWTCGAESEVRRAVAEPEAGYGGGVYLSCDPTAPPKRLAPEGPRAAHGPIQVHSAAYGQRCARADDTATAELAQSCDGRWTCEYTVPFGSPTAPGRACGEDYAVAWTCGDDPDLQTVHLPPNAGPSALVVLHCP